MLLSFGPWRPDTPDLGTGCTDATNVVPDVSTYEPQAALVGLLAPTNSRVQGALAVFADDGGVWWFAGDYRNLYVNAGTTSWSIVSRNTPPWSRPVGLGVTPAFGTVPIFTPHGLQTTPNIPGVSISPSGVIVAISALSADDTDTSLPPPILIPHSLAVTPAFGFTDATLAYPSYSVSTDGAWEFVQYGNNVYATDFNDPIQVYSLGATHIFANLEGGSPHARHLAVVKNFLVAANTWDNTDGFRPQRVRWSNLDAPARWTLTTGSLADFQDLLGDGGENQGIVVGLTQADAVVLQERAVWRMTYAGSPLVFEFDKVEGARGTPSPGSMLAVGGICFYLGSDGFYAFDGAQSSPIGFNRIDRTFWADVDTNYLYRISSVADIARKLIFWAYPSSSSYAGNPDRILVYNWGVGEWSRLEVDVELLWRTYSFSYTLEDLDLFGTLETIVSSFDARVWQGGIAQLSAFDPSHIASTFTGGSLPGRIATSETTMSTSKRFFVTQTRPIVEADRSNVYIAVGHRSRPTDSVSFEPSTVMNDVGFCPQRISDKYLRYRMSLSASTVWSHAAGINVDGITRTSWR